jgi:hypothetical protein
MRKLIVSCVAVVCVGTAAGVQAQSAGEGSIRGQAKDDQSAVIQAVKVTATSPDAPAPREVQTDDSGYYRLLDLAPGTYTLTAERDGFSTWVREGIVVRAGLNLSVDIVMKVGGVSETVQVTLDTPLLESKTAVNAFNVSGDFQRALPLSNRRNWSDYLMVTPGVSSFESGGLKAFMVNGSTTNSHVFQVDGMDVMATRTSTHTFMNLNTDAISDVQIKTSAIDASSPMGLGAIVELVSPSGGDSLAGAAAFNYQPMQWNDNNTPGGSAPRVLIRQGDMSLGGPLRRQQAWFFAAYRRVDNNSGIARTAQQVTNLRRVLPSFESTDVLAETGNHFFTKGTAQLASNQQLTLSYTRDYNSTGLVFATDAAPFVKSEIGGPVFGARLSSIWGSSLTTRLLVSHNRKGIEIRPQGDGPARLVHLGTIAQGGRLAGTGLIATLDNASTPATIGPTTKWTVSGDATLYRQTGLGSHEIQVGIWAQPVLHDESLFTYPANGLLYEEVVLRASANGLPTLQPFHRVVYDDREATNTLLDSRDVAVYLQDAWRPSARLTISAGVRVDFVKRRDLLVDELLQDSTEVGPRFGVNYRLFESSIVRGNWGRVHENLSAGASALSGARTVAGFRDLYDLDLDGGFETTFISLPSTAQVSNRVIDPDLHQARADEWGVGFLQQLPGAISVDTSFTRRAYKDRTVLIDTNPIYEGSVFTGFRDNRFALVNRVTNNIWNWPVYKGLDLRVTKQTARAQIIAGYTRIWRHIEGTWLPNDPASFIQPDAFPNDRGIGINGGVDPGNSLLQNNMSFNAPWRDHNFMAAGTYVAPWGLSFSARYGFLSGNWSGPIITQGPRDPAFGPATAPLANGTPGSNPLNTAFRFAFPTRGEGQFTLPGIHELNVRVARDFNLGRSRLNIALDGFNVSNEGNTLLNVASGTNVTFSPSYRLGMTPQPPRSAQLSVRVSF